MKPLKYITEPASLVYYGKDLVDKVISYYETEIRPKLVQVSRSKNADSDLVDFIDRVSRSRRAEAPKSYNSRYDRFCNYVMYLLEKLNMIDNLKSTFYDINFDTIICIIAAHVRNKLK